MFRRIVPRPLLFRTATLVVPVPRPYPVLLFPSARKITASFSIVRAFSQSDGKNDGRQRPEPSNISAVRVFKAFNVRHHSPCVNQEDMKEKLIRDQVNPKKYNLVMIRYFTCSTTYEFDVLVPKEKQMAACVSDRVFIQYERGDFGEYLKEKLQSLPSPSSSSLVSKLKHAKNKRLCLKIADLVATNIRGMGAFANQDDDFGNGTFVGEVEVGEGRKWILERLTFYVQGREILREELEDGVLVRLCGGENAGGVLKSKG